MLLTATERQQERRRRRTCLVAPRNHVKNCVIKHLITSETYSRRRFFEGQIEQRRRRSRSRSSAVANDVSGVNCH
jgi:hypothetical protein